MKKRRTMLITVLMLALIFAALLADSAWRLTVTDYSVRSAAVPESFDGFTVVQLSDLHGAEFGKGNSRLVKKTAAAGPDIIVLTGDFADKHTDMSVIAELMPKLADIAPVYYVSGNHEWGAGRIEEIKEIFAESGVRYLSNEYVLLGRGDENIVLAGVEDPNAYASMPKPTDVVEQIENEVGESFRLLLGHRNYWVDRYPGLDVDVVMCGHAHGGIVRLPWLGGVLGTGFEFFPENEDGAVRSGRYTMIVSRGLGNSTPVPRFLNNPEIVVLRLEKEG